MNTKTYLSLLGILVAAVLIATAISLIPRPEVAGGDPTVVLTYACNGGKTIAVAYYEGETIPPSTPDAPPTPGGSVSLALSDGRSLQLPQTLSADGARFANEDESFVFWSKGAGALVLEDNVEKSYIGCIVLAPEAPGFTQAYINGDDNFSLRFPAGYTVDEAYTYQVNPTKIIKGIKFIIPPALADGTNLSSDSYISVEQIMETPACTADLFLDGTHEAVEQTDAETTYSVAAASNAGAGNRYEETVYAYPGTNPCMAVRYLIHYSVFENYPEGSIKEFDKAALVAQFDEIRRRLVINQ